MSDVRLDRLLGRVVLTANNRPLGRLEEFRIERRGSDWTIAQFVVGSGGLLERLGLGARLVVGFGKRRGFVIRWDQLDLTNPERPQLKCSQSELEPL